MASAVVIDRHESVAVVSLNRPERRNAFTDIEQIDEIAQSIRNLNADRETRCIILTGKGTAFSAGGDINEMMKGSSLVDENPEITRMLYRRGIQQLPELFEAIEVPVIAAVNGPAMGAGCDLALMCDIRIASEAASFAQTFVKLGLVSGDGGAWLLPRLLSYSDACELALTGDVIRAQRALEIGLVSKVVPADMLMNECLALAERITSNPPDGVRMTKRLLRLGRNMQMNSLLEVSAAMQAVAHTTAAHKEALRATYIKLANKREDL